jgi:hypothetical protein
MAGGRGLTTPLAGRAAMCQADEKILEDWVKKIKLKKGF